MTSQIMRLLNVCVYVPVWEVKVRYSMSRTLCNTEEANTMSHCRYDRLF